MTPKSKPTEPQELFEEPPKTNGKKKVNESVSTNKLNQSKAETRDDSRDHDTSGVKAKNLDSSIDAK
jgi:hypothetical protein